MKIRLLFAILFSLTPFISSAQHEECGTEISKEDLQFINAKLQQSLSFKDRSPSDSIVPIKFHIISVNSGAGGLDSALAFAELDKTNLMYINAGIKFVHCGAIDYIKDNSYVNFERGVSETICDLNDIPNVLNVYFAPNVFRITNGSQVDLCGYAYTSSITKNRIVMANSCSTNGSTLPHEIGHYFSLAHTHSTSGGGELANGSNCNTAGDQLCDTPADPGLSTLIVSSACAYTGTFLDGNNQPYAPNVKNIMSYSRKSCRTEFSAGQYSRMQNYFQTFRNYLACSYPTASNNIQKTSSLKIYPNPSYANIYIENSIEKQEYTMYDMLGNIILSDQLRIGTNSISLAAFATGLYIIKSGSSVYKINKIDKY